MQQGAVNWFFFGFQKIMVALIYKWIEYQARICC
jgi:hypothetical protein